MGTVRIFLGPETDDRGTPFTFEEQRLLMFEMDKFSYKCKCVTYPRGIFFYKK